jgi:hypothetical protein
LRQPQQQPTDLGLARCAAYLLDFGADVRQISGASMKEWGLSLRSSLIVLLLCSTVLSCGTNSPGSISIDLTWEETPAEVAWVWLRIEHRTDEFSAGTILSSTGPHLFNPGEPLPMEMPEVPVGSERVLVVEVRAGENPGLPIRRYGISQPFRLETGSQETMEVSVLVHRPEAEYNDPELTLLFDGVARERAQPGAMQEAILRVRSSQAVSLVAANDASFIANQQELSLKTGEQALCETLNEGGIKWSVCDLLGWNIKAGVDEQGDVSYPVYIRLVDRYGYESKSYLTSVIQDSVEPTVLSASLSMQAPAGAGPGDVSAIAEGTTVEVVFTVSEPLAVDPTITATRGEHQVLFGAPAESGGEGGNTYTFTTVATGLSTALSAQGEYVVEVQLEDLAGNQGTYHLNLLKPFLVDSIPPAALASEKQKLVHLYRVPWGSAASGGEPLAELRACPPPEGTDWPGCPAGGQAFGPASVVAAYAASIVGGIPTCTDDLLDTGTTTATGTLSIPLDPDQLAVCVAETDASGKSSEPFPVTHVQWVATMGGKVAGSEAENPNRFENRSWFGPELWPQDGPPAVEPLSTGTLAQLDGPAVQVSGASRWFDCSGGIENREVWRFDMAFDAARNRLVRFGGLSRLAESSSTAKESGLTWEWNGHGWFEVSQSGPAPRHGHGLSYNKVLGVAVLFGGLSGGNLLGDTWGWDGSNWFEYQMAGPESRAFHSLVYDGASGRTILFGGQATELLDDTWVWDGQKWVQVELVDLEDDGNPPARSQAAMSYDADRNVAILYGGCANLSCSERLEDTWEFDGRSWREVKAAGPGPRSGHAMTFDAFSGTTVLFGGSGVTDGTWRFDGHAWTELNIPGPMARHSHRLEWDSHRQAAVLFGGNELGFETWELAGAHWSLVDAGWLPDYTGGHLLDYDPVGAASTLLEAGVDDAWHFAIWRWLGRGWQPVANVEDYSPYVGGPMSDGDGDAAWDPVRQRLVHFGGGNKQAIPQDETWEWDGEQWAKLAPSDPEGDGNPPPRVGHKLVFAPDRGTVLLFGGTDDFENESHFSDTWEWDGKSWALVDGGGEGPDDRVDMAVSYDIERSVLQVVGGTMAGWTCEPHAWELSAQGWQQTVAAHVGRTQHQLVYDPVAGKSLMWGGQSCADPDCGEGSGDLCRYLWEFDGEEWSLLATDGPSGRTRFGLTYDLMRERLVLFGGVGSVAFGPTWEWDRGRQARPAQVMLARLEEAVAGSLPAVTEIAARWQAGATAYPEGEAVAGAQLLFWKDGGWLPVASNEAPEDAPTTLTYESDGPTAATAAVGEGGTVAFAVVPVAANGLNPKMVALSSSYVEVRVAFRFPSAVEVFCGDGLDDDYDGSIDCLDDDCWCDSGCGLQDAGCCLGSSSVLCDGAGVVATDCATADGGATCGWLEDESGYGCGGTGSDPSGTLPLTCPGGCLPNCHNKQCGGNGCGGLCGLCSPGANCVAGICTECVPECAGKECGSDGCGGSCGACQDGAKCFGSTCVQGPCYGITYEGCCDGQLLSYCDSGNVKLQDCGDGRQSCGWNAADQYYDCGTPGKPDPTGVHPMDCPSYD